MRIHAAVALLLALAAAAPARAASLDLHVFAPVPAPGQPEGLAIAPDGDVYTSSYNNGRSDPSLPGTVFRYDPSGRLVRRYPITGEDITGGLQGAGGIAFDARGLMYVTDAKPARIVTIDPATGAQRAYASFPTLPACGASGPDGHCTLAVADSGPLVVALAFDVDGTLYATDTAQAVIWEVPPGGGEPTVWFTDARLAGPYGANKLRWTAARDALLITQTLSLVPDGLFTPGAGGVLRLPRRPDGSPGTLEKVWESAVNETPDGLDLARSGHLYVSTSGGNQLIELNADGHELGRAPDPVANATASPSVDGPSTVAFLGDTVLMANQSFLTGTASNWALLQADVGEPGVPPILPLGEPGRPCPRATIHLRATRPPTVRVSVRLGGRLLSVVRGRSVRRVPVPRPATGRAVVVLRLSAGPGRPARRLRKVVTACLG